jgi:hypothetical protein
MRPRAVLVILAVAMLLGGLTFAVMTAAQHQEAPPPPVAVPSALPVPVATGLTDIQPLENAGCDEGCFATARAICCPQLADITDPGTPDTLTRDTITTALASLAPAAHACVGQASRGVVRLRIGAAPAGWVTGVDVETASDRELGACVAKAVATARFAKTRHGGSFGYRYAF